MKFSYSLIKKLLPQAPAKTKLADALNAYSFETENLAGDLLDISLPSNRYSDAASHLGIAREASAIYGTPLKNPVKRIVNQPSDKGFLKLEVKEPKFCPRYSARYFKIGKIGDSSSQIQKTLKACGLKPINAVVDIMNYAMLEVGQPLHAFDADKLKTIDNRHQTKKIIVRKAKKGEKIETLDGQKFVLDGNDLVIADSEKALAIAGIKGGANSGVDGKTKRIIVEAANFAPVSIFKTSRRLKLQTDASIRFSHGLSPSLVDWGLDRATELLVKTGAKLVDSVDAYPKPAGEELIAFDVQKYEELIGAPVSANVAKSYFRALGFSIEPGNPETRKPAFLVRIPSWRVDVEQFEDLAEEISRLAGYNALKPQPPAVSIKPAEEEDAVVLKDRIRELLTAFNVDEVYNYSFIGDKRHQTSGLRHQILSSSAEMVELENPLSKDFRYLRPDLGEGLLDNAESNSRFFETVRIFELGKVFSKKGDEVDERLHLGIVLSGASGRLIFELKGIADEMLRGLGLTDFDFLEKGGVIRVEADRKAIGALAEFAAGKKRTAAVAEFDLDKILPLLEEEREFKPLPKYPAVLRDISLLVPVETRIGRILEVIQAVSSNLVEDVDLVDEYRDEKFGGKMSITFRVIFQAEDRTLTDKEVNREMEKISAKLKKDFRAEIR